jgi:hypothetical protein
MTNGRPYFLPFQVDRTGPAALQRFVTGGDGNSFVCGIESLNDERFAAAGHYSE